MSEIELSDFEEERLHGSVAKCEERKMVYFTGGINGVGRSLESAFGFDT